MPTTLRDIIGEYSLVAKVNVADRQASIKWYQDKLGLEHDPQFDTSTWAQLNTGTKQIAIGLTVNPSRLGTGGAATTFVVSDIAAARQALINLGVPVGPIQDAGHGVLLAFFNDPDGNSLGLRQNPPG